MMIIRSSELVGGDKRRAFTAIDHLKYEPNNFGFKLGWRLLQT